jgi:RES domain-containing protein
MPRLWRISNYADLSGAGGRLYAARWHNAGRPILYAAESPAGALVEFLVHLARRNLPATFQLLGIDFPEGSTTRDVDPAALFRNWTYDHALTRGIGDRWLASLESLLLRVPSAILPHTWNVLINPAHPALARAAIVSTDKVPLDARLSV